MQQKTLQSSQSSSTVFFRLTVLARACLDADMPALRHNVTTPLQVVLQDQLEVDPEDADSITTLLEQRVENMIKRATQQAGHAQASKLPLIRLKVWVHW